MLAFFNRVKINKINCLLAWMSIFALVWLWILKIVAIDWKTGIFMAFFLIVAFFSAFSDRLENVKN